MPVEDSRLSGDVSGYKGSKDRYKSSQRCRTRPHETKNMTGQDRTSGSKDRTGQGMAGKDRSEEDRTGARPQGSRKQKNKTEQGRDRKGARTEEQKTPTHAIMDT
jgi:hypothetical protein